MMEVQRRRIGAKRRAGPMRPPPRKRLRIIVADDHELVRNGIQAALARVANVQVVAEASNGRMALERCEELGPDILVTDLQMPDMDGLTLLREVRRRFPAIRTVVLTMHAEEASVREALSLGAAAYVVKDSAADELELALRAIERGALYLSASVSGLATAAPRQNRLGPHGEAGADVLTPRQREILTLIASGMTTQAIAHQLSISVKTAETHRAQLMDRLGIHDLASLVRYAIREGLVTTD